MPMDVRLRKSSLCAEVKAVGTYRYRYVMKRWLSGGNLPWFVRRCIDAIRAR
jgi:hypothetical protein